MQYHCSECTITVLHLLYQMTVCCISCRARTESQSLVSNVTSMVDQRCAQLVNQGGEVCQDVMGQITERFNQLTSEVTVEVRKQCDNTKQVKRDWLTIYFNDHKAKPFAISLRVNGATCRSKL